MIVVSGDAGVGKTALLQRFAQPDQNWDSMDHVSTIGVDFVRKPIRVGGKGIMLQSWDTAG